MRGDEINTPEIYHEYVNRNVCCPGAARPAINQGIDINNEMVLNHTAILSENCLAQVTQEYGRKCADVVRPLTARRL